MKNDEWGAVAYLSKSKYGKNAEVTINSNSCLLYTSSLEEMIQRTLNQ